jgi:hypothetical protein
MCVACREMRPKREMARVVRTPGGEVRLDPTGKAAGRGAYVDPREVCLDVAERQRRLQQALEVEIPAAVWDELRALLNRPGPPPPPKVIRLPAGRARG